MKSANVKVVLLDLDDTLIKDRESADEALRQAGHLTFRQNGIDPERFAQAVRQNAKRIFASSSLYPECRRLGISSLEVLWASFNGQGELFRTLREWMPFYRQAVWSSALGGWSVYDSKLAQKLAEVFVSERRKRQILFPETLDALRALCRRYKLGLITNGAPDTQRKKIRATGIQEFFSVIIISGEVGCGKPDPQIIRRAWPILDCFPWETVMIGDTPSRDLAAAWNAGIPGILVKRGNHARDTDQYPAFAEIETLAELPPLLQSLK